MTERTCKQCQMTKPLDDFPLRRKDGIDYRAHLCRDCYNAQRKLTRPSVAKPGWTPPPKPYLDSALGIEVKVCTQCRIPKPLSEFGSQRGKVRAICKDCANKNARADYQADPEKHRQQALDYAKRNPDKVKSRMKRWRSERRAYVLGYYQQYNVQHREERRAYDRKRRANRPAGFYASEYKKYRSRHLAWHAQNRDRTRANERAWRMANPDKHADKESRRRARKANAPVVEVIDRKAIIERDNSTCYLCGTVLPSNKVTLDHVIPLARGGEHSAANLKVACLLCNIRKGARTPDEL